MKFEIQTAAPNRVPVSVEKQTKWESLLFELVQLYVEEHPDGREKLQALLEPTNTELRHVS